MDVDSKSIRSWIAESECCELKATLGAAKLKQTNSVLESLSVNLQLHDKNVTSKKPLSIQRVNATEFAKTGMKKLEQILHSYNLSILESALSQKWTMPLRDWKTALNSFTFQFED